MFKLQSSSKYFPFDVAIHLLRFFSTAQNSFWTCWFWCLLVLLLLFLVSPLPHWQNISLWGPFSSEETKKKLLGVRLVNKEGGAQGVKLFWVKNCWMLSMVWAGALVNHPSGNGQMRWESLKKNSLKLNAASHKMPAGTWYRWVPKTLTSRGSLYYKGLILQKISQVIWGVPSSHAIENTMHIKYTIFNYILVYIIYYSLYIKAFIKLTSKSAQRQLLLFIH